MFWFKKKEVPETNNTKQIDVVQTWEVRWHSRHSEFSGGTQPEVEVFTSELDAANFKKSLQNAFKLLKHTSGTYITSTKSK